ncbi:MAG: DUF1449 domain-containing protein [Lyngbya sp.]|nr:DUF1449 domain-containing protein [Lyngbya sp.]
MLFHLANLPYWILLAMGILLFLLVIFGGAGDEEVDVDTDVDVDVDADLDADVDAEGDFTPLQLLGWLGFGQVPLLLLLATDFSLVGLLGWMFNVIAGELTGSLPSAGLSGLISIGAVGLGLYLGSAIARPIGQLFAAFGEDTRGERLIGRLGIVTSVNIPKQKIGQVDVLDGDGNRVTISATLPEWSTVIPQRGEEVLIISRQPQAYLAIAKDSPDQQRWLSDSSD